MKRYFEKHWPHELHLRDAVVSFAFVLALRSCSRSSSWALSQWFSSCVARILRIWPVMQEAVQHGGDCCGIGLQFSLVLDGRLNAGKTVVRQKVIPLPARVSLYSYQRPQEPVHGLVREAFLRGIFTRRVGTVLEPRKRV